VRVSGLRALLPGVLGTLFRDADVNAMHVDDVKARFRLVVNDLCAAARANGVSIEQVIIDTKDVFAALPETRIFPPYRRADLQSLLVSACIQAYFEQAPPAPD
jgi:hypothetical protein